MRGETKFCFMVGLFVFATPDKLGLLLALHSGVILGVLGIESGSTTRKANVLPAVLFFQPLLSCLGPDRGRKERDSEEIWSSSWLLCSGPGSVTFGELSSPFRLQIG